jgi:hypothetical protein
MEGVGFNLVQHAVNACLPEWQLQAKGGLQLGGVQPRIVGALGRCWEGRRGNSPDFFCYYFYSWSSIFREG